LGDEVPEQLLISLKQEGFTLYPGELDCNTPNHRWVDIAACKDDSLWAFEFKSRGDSLKRGLSQCLAYSLAFDYVVLIAQGKRLTRSRLFQEFRKGGIGLWSLHGSRFLKISEPKPQRPQRRYRARMRVKFINRFSSSRLALVGPVKKLDLFSS
jgi:hypothetical protein